MIGIRHRESTMTLPDRAMADIGRGLVAGLIGTAAMTVSSTIESKLRDRGPSSAPADAAGEVLGVEPVDEEGEARFGNLVHWSYGTGWGAVRGALGTLGLGPIAATGAHLGMVVAAEQIALPATGTAPPATEWGTEEVAIDVWHHLVYAAATGIAYEMLRRA